METSGQCVRLCFSPHPSDFQRLALDKRVSQALNGDLYFSNVLPEDTRSDYICYARFPHTQTIQQKQPISVTVLDSKSWHWIQLHSTIFQELNQRYVLIIAHLFHIYGCFSHIFWSLGSFVSPVSYPCVAPALALDECLCCSSLILPFLSF